MTTEEEATAAIEMSNGKELDGRAITVNEARPQEDRPKRSFGGGGGRSFDRNQGGSRGGSNW
jgi:RNA recognition motif-containing protein